MPCFKPGLLSGPCLTAARAPSRLQQDSSAKPRKLVPSNSLAGTAALAVSEARAAGARTKMNGTRPGTRAPALTLRSLTQLRGHGTWRCLRKSQSERQLRQPCELRMRTRPRNQAALKRARVQAARAGVSRGAGKLLPYMRPTRRSTQCTSTCDRCLACRHPALHHPAEMWS